MRKLLGNPILKIIAVILFVSMTIILWTNTLTFIKYVNLGVYWESEEFNYYNTEVSHEVYLQGLKIEESVELAMIQYFQPDSGMSEFDLAKNIESIIDIYISNK